jgi:uncharacterized protein (TIGR02266 family)
MTTSMVPEGEKHMSAQQAQMRKAIDTASRVLLCERRAQSRYRVDLDVSLGAAHNFYVGFAENMSTDGAFIATHMLKQPGEVLDLSIHIPGSDATIGGKCEVRWVRPYAEGMNLPPGVGVRFVQLAPGSYDALVQFLARRKPILFDGD